MQTLFSSRRRVPPGHYSHPEDRPFFSFAPVQIRKMDVRILLTLEHVYILETVHFGHFWWCSNLEPQHLQCGSSPSALTLLVSAGLLGCWFYPYHWKSKRVPEKTSISALSTMPKPLTVWITINCGKFWNRWEYHTTWPASWEICMQVRKQHLELDMEHQTGSQ